MVEICRKVDLKNKNKMQESFSRGAVMLDRW
jgi:hypothetical protein